MSVGQGTTLCFLYAAGIITEEGHADPGGIRQATGISQLSRGAGAARHNFTLDHAAAGGLCAGELEPPACRAAAIAAERSVV